MTLDERLDEALKLNRENLDDSIVEFIELHSLLSKSYLKILREINEVEAQLEDRLIERYSYYKVDYNIQLSTQEIKLFVDNDTELSSLRKKLKDLKAAANFREKQIKNVEQARWDAKNLIDYMKLKSGIL